MLSFLVKLFKKQEPKKIEPKKPIPQERIDAVAPPVKEEPIVTKLEVKKFTESFKSTDPVEQIDQIITFYNKFTVGKEFYLKYKTPITAECPDLLLKQIYLAQELCIKHLNRLPFAEELRLSVLIDNPKKMQEVIDEMPKSVNKHSLALRALSMELPLVLFQDQKPKTI